MTLEKSVVVHRLHLLRLAEQLGSVTQACRQQGVSRTLFYRLRRRLLRYGEVAFGRGRPDRSLGEAIGSSAGCGAGVRAGLAH